MLFCTFPKLFVGQVWLPRTEALCRGLASLQHALENPVVNSQCPRRPPHHETAAPGPRICSPLPTAIEFITATALQNTLTRRLVAYLDGILRRFATITTLLRGLKNRPASASMSLVTLHPPRVRELLHSPPSAVSAGTPRLAWLRLLLASAGVPPACIFAGGFTEESLLVTRKLRVRTWLTAPTPWIGCSCRLIPTDHISDLRIHVGFYKLEGWLYLALVV